MNHNKIILALLLAMGLTGFAQEEEKEEKASNIQTYTPSKLLNKGQWDLKWGNNLYTEVKTTNENGDEIAKDRENYFTSTLEAFIGVSENNRINVGLIAEYRSNTTKKDRQALSVFSLKDDPNSERKGLTSIAPAIKFQPIGSVSNFSIQSAIHIPLIKDETNEAGVWLDQTSWSLQNRFFFDYTFPSNDWQLFAELNTQYNFGDEDSFFNKTFGVTPSVFMSYFPSSKTTVLGFVQHYALFGDETQDYSAVGLGGKYQLTDSLNLEVLYSKFVRGTNNGLGQSFNIGLRVLL